MPLGRRHTNSHTPGSKTMRRPYEGFRSLDMSPRGLRGRPPPGGRLVKVNLERSKTYEGHTIGSGPWTCHRGGHGKADTEGSKVLA
jgi:hypothetical protein